jgi:subtilisin family serine protease
MKKICNLTTTKTNAKVASIITLVTALTGCFGTPDQTIVKPEHKELANPTPTARAFQKINQNHKVLMAVFDSGIDYNHPELKNNIHFELNSNGEPISAGYDYLGKDEWPSYRIVNTEIYDYAEQSSDKKKEIDERSQESDFNKTVRADTQAKQCKIDAVTSVSAKLKDYVHAYRAQSYEAAGEYIHGTHVAGLMTYNRPDFGLIAYRVLPYHVTKAEGREESLLKTDYFVSNIENALNRMAKIRDANGRPVRIVNLSLGGSLQKPNGDDGPSDQEQNEKFERARSIIYHRLTDVIKSHPGVLFVAAAGNDGGWSESKTRIQYPCGIEAENVLCVGATNNFEELSTFTNIPLNNVDLVFAPGFEIKSLYPSDQCRAFSTFMESTINSDAAGVCKYEKAQRKWVVDAPALNTFAPVLKAFVNACKNSENRYVRMSGTSMATPIVSHLAGEILANNPNYSPTDVIREIKKRATVRPGKTFSAFILEKKNLTAPNWGAATGEKNVNSTSGSLSVAPALLKSFEDQRPPQNWDASQLSAWQRGFEQYKRAHKVGVSLSLGM